MDPLGIVKRDIRRTDPAVGRLSSFGAGVLGSDLYDMCPALEKAGLKQID